MRWAGHVACMRDRKGAYRILVERTEGKRKLGRPTRRGYEHIKLDLQEVGWGHGMDCYGSGYGQVVGSCRFGDDLRIKCGEFLD
jgi:hypothetical protein